MTTALSLEEVKTRQQKTWSSGDYGKVAWITVPLADALCEAADLRPGSTVLDVATGTGHVGLAAARRFCAVTGSTMCLPCCGRRAPGPMGRTCRWSSGKPTPSNCPARTHPSITCFRPSE